MASKWTSWMRAVTFEGTRISTSSGSNSEAKPLTTGEGHHGHLAVVSGLDGLDHVSGVAAGRNCQEHVARLTEGTNLLGEYLVVAVIVGDRGDGRAVSGQCDGRQARTFTLEAVEQLRGEVLGVAG